MSAPLSVGMCCSIILTTSPRHGRGIELCHLMASFEFSRAGPRCTGVTRTASIFQEQTATELLHHSPPAAAAICTSRDKQPAKPEHQETQARNET